MGAIARNAANNITTAGVFTADAITNASVTGITVLANASDGITFISSQTASNSASISFTSGLTSTYKAYKFVFSNMKPATDNDDFQFNLSTDGGSNYNVNKTTTAFWSYHKEDDTDTVLGYRTSEDLGNSSAYQWLNNDTGNASDESLSGSMILFNPSQTSYVKNFIANTNSYNAGDYSTNMYINGHGNTASAINAISFKFAGGNISAGTIALYGIK